MSWHDVEQHWQRVVAVAGLSLLTLRYWGKVRRIASGATETILYPFTAIRELAESIKRLTSAFESMETLVGKQTDLITRISHATETAHYKVNYLIDECPIGTFECELPSGKCINVNRALCRLFNLTPAEMIEFGWMAAIHPDDRARVIDTWLEACKTQRPYAARYRIAKGDAWLTVIASGKIVRSSDGTAISFLGTVVPLPITTDEPFPSVT